VVVVPREQREAIISHVLEKLDEESCGILGGRDGQVVQIYRGTNVAENRRTRFTMDPHDILKISDAIDEADQELLGFYHSHTHTRAYPSPTDVADWPSRWYPDALCFICSLMEEDRPDLRAYRISEDGQVTEEEIREA
jgi:proteasome lid subunit RPN8/RPN11